MSDDSLRTVECHANLFYSCFHCNQCILAIDDRVEYSCYLVFDRVRGKFAQAGSASAKLVHTDTKGT